MSPAIQLAYSSLATVSLLFILFMAITVYQLFRKPVLKQLCFVIGALTVLSMGFNLYIKHIVVLETKTNNSDHSKP